MERHLIRAFVAARDAFDADPFSEALHLALAGARDDLAEFILLDVGRPAEDLQAGKQYEVDRNGEIQEMPLAFRRFYHWARFGAEANAPAFMGV